MHKASWRNLLLMLLLATSAQAAELPVTSNGKAVPAMVRVAFTPGDDIAGQIVEAIRQARHQVLVQAYSLTHDQIANALRDAKRRGIDVKVIADRHETEIMERSQVPGLARAGLPVWLDGEHQSAHDKVMVIDAGTPSALIITGSFNFTRAAQHKNAENAVFISGNDGLTQAYVQNWQRHVAHAQPLTIH